MRTVIVASVVFLGAAIASPAVAEPPCDRHAQIWLDDTGSVAPGRVNETAFQAVEIIAGLPDAKGVCRIDLYQFTDQAMFATPFHQVHLPTSERPSCAAASVSGELAWLTRVQRTEAAKAADTCKYRKTAWDDQQATLRRREVAKARGAIDSRARLDGRCTALTDVARRLARTPSTSVKLALIVTDAIQSCMSSGRSVEARKAPLKAVMVVMPKRVGRSGGDDFDRIAGHWQRFAPWIDLVLPDELGDVFR